MGFACSPVMCNIYFAYFEYKFYANHSNAWDKDLLEGLKHSYRYMDDLLSVNNKNFKTILQEIYPMEAITIEPTFLETLEIENEKFITKTTYLNLEISLVTPFLGVNNIKYTWKRDKLPIIPCEFVKRKSNRPFKASLNTFLGTFHLIAYSI